MAELTIGPDGKVTLPSEVLEHLGVKPGQKLIVEKLPEGHLEFRAARSQREPVSPPS